MEIFFRLWIWYFENNPNSFEKILFPEFEWEKGNDWTSIESLFFLPEIKSLSSLTHVSKFFSFSKTKFIYISS